ncbi:chromosome segregation protein SMC [Clostridium oryzae]|uniref:Chromosome partition protein Smc n=1 Tax=Clostridium oryzae TaxID=1450648 RepID=A0A1V4IP20_9CLOT|nr:chromosome segregation protein SMC [Clostridium oryzae]OPJ61782.1 chromosome partition protein Smc [Clostridium oryzae]
MFLRTLEIRGFKSFADKTELKFKDGVTAVVGPNGSGKSNISDAVRWVLGEQSVKSLRGGKMEDVIFAGTEYRKPVGLAQVAITLDNLDYELPIDYSSVTISRRLYRSGDSEYYINNTQCRLKDIQELLMDTGIGKEGYSIIGQGKIDAILSGRPEERRNLLEEAAGIVKYKSRKEEAEKKLDNTEQNLLRIFDILSTYEDRIEPLRIENEKAKKFLELSETLKEEEVSVIVHFINENEKKVKEFTEAARKLQSKMEVLIDKREQKKLSIKKLYDEVEENENRSASDKEKYYSFLNERQDLVSKNNVLQERINNLNENIKKYEDEKKQIEAQMGKLESERKINDDELINYIKDQKQVIDKLQEFENKIQEKDKELINKENAVNEGKNVQIELVRKITAINNDINSININLETIEKRKQQIYQFIENNHNSIKVKSVTIQDLKSQQTELTIKNETQKQDIKDKKRKLTQLNSNIFEQEKSHKEKINIFNKLEANYLALENLEKHYEGYNRSVKMLMQDIEQNKIQKASEKAFVLGNIISVEKRLETAIEIALGGAVSNIITSDDGVAKVLIEYLKKNRLGRATFLPLNIIKGKRIDLHQKVNNLNGYIGIASELIKYDDRFTTAIDYVLGRTIICDNIDNALNIAKRTDFSYRIVTLTGEMVNAGGSMTGGSIQQKGSNVIGRKREIEETKEKLSDLKNSIVLEEVNIDKLKAEAKNLDDTILNIRDNIHFNEIEITKLYSKIESLSDEINRLGNDVSTLKEEVNLIEEKAGSLRADIGSLTNKKSELEKAESDNKQQVEDIQKYLLENKSGLEELKNEFNKLNVDKAKMDEVVLNRKVNLTRIKESFDEANTRLSSIVSELDTAIKNIALSNENIEKNESIAKEIDAKLKSYDEQFKKSEVERIHIKDIINQENTELENIQQQLKAIEEEKHIFDIDAAKNSTETENFYHKLNEEYKLTLAEAQDIKIEIADINEMKKHINKLKTQISALGTINLGAIEEYKETAEKYSFMKSQKDDLIQAKTELVEVINEMTQKMKDVFNTNFKKLRENFNETFKELFKGGNADLILGQGDELVAPIEINVQPPGKKLQNINLMSGGEKVLSAIALLFAILKMKPTPFCILDEIEAALDDANVIRYAEFLKTFSNNIQFIVITHRKGTMEASDVMYGVTMEEKGVSKIVSVDLKK